MIKNIIIILTIAFVLTSCDIFKSPTTTDEYKIGKSNYSGTITRLQTFESHNSFSISADGKFYIPSINEYWEKEPQASAREIGVYNTNNGGYVKRFNGQEKLGNLFGCNNTAFSRDGKYIVLNAQCYNGWFGFGNIFWDQKSDNFYPNNTEFEKVSHMEFSLTSDSIIFCDDYSYSNYLSVYNMYNDSLTRITGFKHTANMNKFKLSPNCKYVMLNGNGCIADITVNPVNEIYSDGGYGGFSFDSKSAIVSKDYTIKFIDLVSRNITDAIIDESNIRYYQTAISKNGKYFATSYCKRIRTNTGYEFYEGVQIWETATKGKVCNYEMGFYVAMDYRNIYNQLEFGEDETTLIESTTYGTYLFKIDYKLK